MVSIVIPTHTFIRKYVVHHSNTHDGVIHVSSTDCWGIMMLKILQKKASWEPNLKLKYEDNITIKISEFFYSKTGFYLSKQNITFFNTFLQSQLEDALFYHITTNKTGPHKTVIEKEIQSYLSLFGINENDKSLDSLLRAYSRWKKDHKYLIINQ